MVKTFNVVSRPDLFSRGIANALSEVLSHNGMAITEDRPEIVITIGGDGTVLEAFHKYRDQIDSVAFLGLHTGHLGFYTDWKKEEFDEIIEQILNNTPSLVKYPLIQLIVNDNYEKRYLALNEVYVKDTTKSMISNVFINGERFESFRGDGLCISTPSGSTAYNKSLNGAIVHPSLEAIQLSEMASVNNNVYRTIGSSIILPKHHDLEIELEESSTIVVGYDHKAVELPNINNLKLKVSNEKVSFARYRAHTFWNRVRESFL